MTDESPDGPMSETPRIRVRRPDGEWEDLPSSPPLSDKPEVNAIGRLTMGEVRKILNDEADSRHEAAVEYDRLQQERMEPMLASVFKGLELSNPLEEAAEALGLRYRNLIADALPMFPKASLINLPNFDLAKYIDEPRVTQPLRPIAPSRPRSARTARPLVVPQMKDAAGDQLRALVKIAQDAAAADRADAATALADAAQARTDNEKVLQRAGLREWIGIGVGILGVLVAVITLVVAG